jgi:hypothetical protein
MRNQVSIDFKLATYMLARLSKLKAGQYEHWLVMAAAADAALVAGGGKAVLVDDPQRFGRVMHLAKVLALNSGGKYGNPMPIVQRPGFRGYWGVSVDPLASANAEALALRYTRTRLRLLSQQMDSEALRPKAPVEIVKAAAALSMLLPMIDHANTVIDDVIAALTP